MPRRARPLAGLLALAALVFVVAGCGSSGKEGGSITILFGTAPDSLDPGFSYTTQGLEPDQTVYTPLYAYAHKSGNAGTQIIPGLAQSLPTISPDGKTYTIQLRKNLVYSNGKPVKASDFPFTLERSMKIGWGGKSFFTSNIVGAAAYDSGKAKNISGITADDATGKITIKLIQPYGPFTNVLAEPSTALVPTGSPMKNEPNNPPPGVGPYMFKSIQPNRGYTLVKNPNWSKNNISEIPSGHLNQINVKIQSNTNAEAQQVLSNQADIFDAGDTVPPALVPRLKSQAGGRFATETIPSTFYFFLNTKEKPFNNPIARQAVNYALDKRAMVKLASGFLKPACFFIPEGITGHPTGPCPYYSANPSGAPNIAKAKQMIQSAGLAGTPVTVWGETRQPRQQYVLYYASVLNQIGFKATPKIISDDSYFPTIGNAKTKAQTGFADWLMDFPHPSDFYLLLDCKAIQPVNNQNFSEVCDPKIQAALSKLNPVPQNKLSGVASQWQAIDTYAAKQAYNLVYGEETLPKFFSNKVDFGSAVFHPLYLNDWLTIKRK